jgi:hypothetical protein
MQTQFDSTHRIGEQLKLNGYAVVSAESVAACFSVSTNELMALTPSWDDLPRDQYLRDGGKYRSRRHSCFTHDLTDSKVDGLQQVEHRAHWQPTDYNALHGGIERWFQPMSAVVCQHPMWSKLICHLGRLFASQQAVPTWFVEAHQFRIDTSAGIGRPTPEGAHRDGVNFVAIVMIRCHHIKGGETRVFAADGPHGIRFTLQQPWSMLLLDDQRVIHETTPILPAHPGDADGHRDTLVLTFRSGSFQQPA